VPFRFFATFFFEKKTGRQEENKREKARKKQKKTKTPKKKLNTKKGCRGPQQLRRTTRSWVGRTFGSMTGHPN
jgi:hypothetical protein